MRLASFNINSIRARLHQIEAVKETIAPDIIGIQETKVQDSEFPMAEINALGYEAEIFGQKGHYGVAVLYKGLKLLSVKKGLEEDSADTQKRFIQLDFESHSGNCFSIINCYFPQGENRSHEIKFPYKQKFFERLNSYLKSVITPGKILFLMGDMNVSPEDIDIGIGEDNRKRWLAAGKCSFLPEERQWYKEMLESGLFDTYRKIYPDSADKFSWFDYRSKGFDSDPKRGLRIDHILATEAISEKIKDAGIDYGIRAMEKPSDHTCIWTDVEL